MNQIIGTLVAMVGVFFVLVAGIGLLRMPDLYLRMSTSTKASTLGLALILVGTAVFFGDLGVTSRALAMVVFVLLTAPVSAHMIGRAAYATGCPVWEGTQLDELRGRYDEQAHTLASEAVETAVQGGSAASEAPKEGRL